MVIDHAVSVRAKKAEVITTYIDVEALPFNRGYYSCDLTFFFEVQLEVYSGSRSSLHDDMRRSRIPEKGHSVWQRRQRQGVLQRVRTQPARSARDARPQYAALLRTDR